MWQHVGVAALERGHALQLGHRRGRAVAAVRLRVRRSVGWLGGGGLRLHAGVRHVWVGGVDAAGPWSVDDAKERHAQLELRRAGGVLQHLNPT